MGVRFEITAVSDNEKLARKSIDAAIDEITRIEKVISSWDANSETSEVNRNAGIQPVEVSQELFDLIRRSKKVSKLTRGIFDISYASMDRIWKFDGSMNSVPDSADVASSVAKIGFNNIILDSQKRTIFLKEKGMKIGFGAIGKGYAANKASDVMKGMGINSGLVNAGGDLITWGKMENDEDWRIGIANPKEKDNIFSWLIVSEMAVVTSGNYEKFFMVDGKKYSHIINPRTGYPATGTKSVTIICPNAELADALATSVFILGKKDGIDLIDQLKGIECLIVTDDDELITSKNLKLNYYTKNKTRTNNKNTVKTIGGK
ncbi:MAG: FAD:protein FMN transferase [Desulfobacterales bacterium]